MEEAGKLAESTAILLNVSEFDDATKASEALISTMQAFQYTADESQHVVDILNEVGNNYAVSSDGIATALQDSASALMEGGNNLEQAIALVAAANKVVQDPNSVGSALRTISLRLRGTSVEILEEMGEETDGVVESTSKLQEKIKALSGIDILTDAGEYKDTYTILKEIGNVWEDMSDIDQAALLELMAGKNRANTLSAILSNMEDLEGAYESAMNAEGSAAQELDTYMNSIQGRIDKFNNSVQTMWMNFLNSDALKFIINFGTAAIKLVDTLGLIPTLLGAITAYKFGEHFVKQNLELAKMGYSSSDIWKKEKDSLFGLKDLTKKTSSENAQNSAEVIAAKQAAEADNAKTVAAKNAAAADDAKVVAANNFINSMNADSSSDVAETIETDAAQRVALAKEKEIAASERAAAADEAKIKAALDAAKSDTAESTASKQASNADISETASSKQAAQADTVEAANSKQAAQADAAEAAQSNAASGADAGEAGSSIGSSVIGSGASGAAIGGIKGLVIGLAVGLVSSLLSELSSWVVDQIPNVEEIAQKAEEALNTYEQATATLKEQKSTIDEISASYGRLSKGVDLDTNENISLTTESYEEYLDVCNNIADMFPNLVVGFDEQGNAILSLKGNVDDLAQSYEDAAQASRQALIAKGNDIFDTFKTNYNRETVWGIDKTGLKQQRELAQDLLEVINTGTDEELNDFLQPILNLLVSDEEGSISHSDLKDMMESAGIEKFYKNVWYKADTREDDQDLYEIDFDKLRRQVPNLESFINSSATQINTESQKVKSLMDAYLGEDLDYASLSEKNRSYVDQIISSFDAEFIDGFDSADELYNHVKTNIVSAFEDPSVAAAVNSLSNLQLGFEQGDVSYADYKAQLSEYVSQIQGKVDETTLGQIKMSVGVDEESLKTDIAHVMTITQGSAGELKKNIESLSGEDLQIAGELEVPEGTLLTWDELLQKIQEVKDTKGYDVTPVKSLSSLTESMDSINEVLSQTSEIVVDNTEVTQEYKDSLIELGISESELNECFYEGNPLVVKNASALNKLIEATKTSSAQNAKLAKSQARLQYYELYKKINKLTNGVKVTDDTTLNYIDSLYEEMNALEKTIAKYSLLESKLLGASNAYDKLAEAQEVDDETDYGGKAEELVNVLGDAINSRQLGAEAAQVAIEGIVPESVLENLSTAEEKMDAIYTYFTNGPIPQLFTIEFDDDGAISSVEMTEDNLKQYINSSDVFNGTWDNFTLDSSITSMEDFMSATNMTKEMAFAFLTELEKYDISWLDGKYDTIMDQLMGDDLEYAIHKTTEQLSELEIKIANGTITQDELSTYNTLKTTLSDLGDTARNNISVYTDSADAIDDLTEQLSVYEQQLDDGEITEEEYAQKASEITNRINELAETMGEIEPTELTIQLAIDDVQDDIDNSIEELKKKYADFNINDYITNKEGTYTVKTNYQGDEDLIELAGYLTEKHSLELTLGDGFKTTEEYISDIADTLNNIYQIIVKIDDSEVKDWIDKGSEANEDEAEPDPTKPATPDEPEPDPPKSDNLSFTQTFKMLGGFDSNIFKKNIPENVEVEVEVETTETTEPTGLSNITDEAQETHSALEAVQDDLTVMNDHLKEIGYTDYTFDFTSTNGDNLKEQINEANSLLDTFKNEDGTFKADVDLRDLNAAQTIMASLIYQKQLLDESDILSVEVEDPTSSIESIIQKLQEFKSVYNELEVEIAVGADTTKTKEQADSIVAELNKEDKTILTKLGIDTDGSYEEINSSINAITSDLMIQCGLDTSLIEDYREQEHTVTGEMVWENNADKVTEWMSKKLIVEGTVRWVNDDSQLPANSKVQSSPQAGGQNPPRQQGGVRVNGTARAQGTAYSGGSWGSPKTETALTGELGPEMLVRGNKWQLIGENGAEFTQVRKGDIIFNHKQTESLLKNGYVTSRGKAYAGGTTKTSGAAFAYAIGSTVEEDYEIKKQMKQKIKAEVTEQAATATTQIINEYINGITTANVSSGVDTWNDTPTGNTLSQDYLGQSGGSDSSLTDSAEDAADEFREVFDWIAVRIEEINEELDLKTAQLDNAVSYTDKNSIIDEMIEINETLRDNLLSAADKYDSYAATLLAEIPEEWQTAAQNGQIAIEEFVGEVDEETYDAIEEYRDWVQKGADATREAEEVITEIRSLVIQQIDNAYDSGQVRTTIEDSQTEKLQNAVDLQEESGLITSDAYYRAMMENSSKKISYWTDARNAMQKEFDEAVEDGVIKKGSDEWYEQIDKLYEVDAEIDSATIELEEFQNAINDIYWDNFDVLIDRLESVNDETQSLIDLLGHDDLISEPKKRTYDGGTVEYWTADDVKWTNEGLASLGLYAQQMENAEYQVAEYGKAIDDLTADYKAGLYSEKEYNEKLDQLTASQYDAIESYFDAKDAIVDLNEARIDSIKDGIDKEIEAYEELIDKKLEELDAEQD